MTKKILLASGCSYTDPHYQSYDPKFKSAEWPMWPQILADYLDLQCVNKARSGKGADYIFDSIIEGIELYGNRIDTIAILWSGSDRIQFFNFTLNPIIEIQSSELAHNPFKWMDDIGVGKVSKKYFKSQYFIRNETYKTMILSPLKKMATIVKLCDYYKIKLIMGQGLIYFDYFAINSAIERGDIPKKCFINFEEVFQIFSKNPFFGSLNKNKQHIIGWPFFHQLNGFSFDDLRVGKKEYFISDLDSHPNKLGQELFAKEFIKRYDKLYSI